VLAPFPLNPIPGIDEVVAGLIDRDVEFVDPAPASFAGREGAIAGAIIDFGPVRSAWLRDSEGNVLALNELVG
jgi:hypothetical protein